MMFDAGQTEKLDAEPPAWPYAASGQQVTRRKEGPAVQASDDMTDWAGLMARVRDHQDRAAFAALFRHFAPRVKSFLMKSGADAPLAEECAQDVMATLWHKAHLFDPSRASVATWIFTIARNRRIDALRRENRPLPVPEISLAAAEPERPDDLMRFFGIGRTERVGANLQDHLELNTEQRTRWQALEPAFLQELAANWQAIRQHREALVRHIFAATPDRAAIDAEQAAIARLQGAQQQRVITQLLAERALLDERQRTRLMELLLNRYAQETTEEEQLHRD